MSDRTPSFELRESAGASRRRFLQLALDAVLMAVAFALAYLLRFEFSLPEGVGAAFVAQLLVTILVQCAALKLTGVHAFIWRYVGLTEAKAFARAAVLAIGPILTLRFVLPDDLQLLRVPVSIAIMDSMLAFGGMFAVRVARRITYEKGERARRGGGLPKGRRVLLIGAGRAGVIAAKELDGRGDMDLAIAGFVDDDPEKLGSVVQGVRVLGTTRDLPCLVPELAIDHVIVTIAEASRAQLSRIVELCGSIPVRVRIIPGLWQLLEGRVPVGEIRNVQIDDLLGREPVHFDERAVSEFVAGKTVMVTGAGGSIGSELSRQVARLSPSRLLLIDRAEFGLFEIERELRRRHPDLSLLPLVADVGDEARMQAIFEAHGPRVVVHAAAHKHVPLMETNPCEAVKNNVLATHTVGELAGRHGCETFVLISTDKAVRPSSVMGATKRIAELVVQELDGRHETRYVAVRFGNVIGSAGSVIPIFEAQIREGGPVTVTHPDMKRYFMTIPESVRLVLQASVIATSGEIFVLDMGEPVRIVDLAHKLIHLSGLRPGEDIEVVFTGVRPGEKISEELDTPGEQLERTRHPKVFVGKIAPYPSERVREALATLEVLARGGREVELRAFLSELLPEASLAVPAESDAADPTS